MKLVLGVDGGGTKTACVLADTSGRILATTVAGPSNFLSMSGGVEEVTNLLKQAIAEVLNKAGATESDVEIAFFAMAGVGLNGKSRAMERIISGLPALKNCAYDNDAVAALAGATTKEWGVVTISGTGSISIGISREGRRTRAGGWGYLIGDEGSGYDIGRKGLQAAARAYDGRGTATLLRRKAEEYYSLDSLDKFRAFLYRNSGEEKKIIASFAPQVMAAAEEGDRTAQEILAHAGRELALSSAAVIRELGLTDTPTTVAACGGVLSRSEHVFSSLQEELKKIIPLAKVVKPQYSPVIGAVILGFNKLQIPVTQEILYNIEKTGGRLI